MRTFGEENFNQTENIPTVILHNEPKELEHEVDEKFNEMQRDFVPHIKEFVEGHELFQDDEEVRITFSEVGVGSIIAIIESSNNKLVLKIPRGKAFSAGEGQFLEIWEEAGVKVPHVEETGDLNNYPYTLMEFVDAPTLSKKFSRDELLQDKKYIEMGETLKKMHGPKANGFGFNIGGRPEFETVQGWLSGKDMRTRFDYVEEHELLGSLHEELSDVLQIIEKHSDANGSSYCHDDFGTTNIFATEPITVFDANPKFNNGYYDLGRSLTFVIANGGQTKILDQLVQGYFGDEKYDKQALYSYIFLTCCMKFTYWHKTNKNEQMKKMLVYLEENKDILSDFR